MQVFDLPNLHDAPFRLGIAPADAVVHRSWREARDAALAALAGGQARIAVLGDTGTGKTLLLHVLAEALREQGRTLSVSGSGWLPAELSSEATVLLDDAERLDEATLRQLAERDGPCVLAGLPTLAGQLPAPFTVTRLRPLPPDEVARFVAVRLAEAGRRRDLLEPDAVLALARLSGGVPRQLNALAGAAVFLAGLDGAATVSRRHVEEAAAMRDGDADVAPSVLPAEPEPGPSLGRDVAATVDPPRAPRLKSAVTGSRWITRTRVVAASAAALLVLVIAGLVELPLGGAPSRQARDPGPAVVTGPVAPPQQEAAAPSPPPAAVPPAAERAVVASPDPAAAVWVPRPRSTTARDSDPPVSPETSTASGPRVVLHYREGAAAEADRIAALLAGQGSRFGRIETRAVRETPHAATIRFFHREDVGAAWALRSALSATGDDWQVRDFTRFQPSPRRGSLEVWIR